MPTIFIFLVTLTITSTASAHHKPPALLLGTVYCDTCFPKATRYSFPGASVVVQCKGGAGSGTRFRQRVKTDSHGEFKVHLPFSVSRRIRGCSVRLVSSSSKPYCAVSASANLHLKSGFFTFRPLKRPEVCDQKPTTLNKFKRLSQISNPNSPALIPPVQDPPSFVSFLPPLPRLPPLPQLPRLPPLPGLPFLPPKKQPAGDVPKLSQNQPDPFPFLPPNPFNLPPVTLPPILPPLFPLPNSPPLLNLPPLPGLFPSQPPPPPPPLQLPPFPFQPTPGFPGVPPAVASEKKSP